ncbi:hypothetical protein ACWEH1_34540 [Micromonospora chersina]
MVMSHVGIFFDEKLCQEIPEIDVIFGSHTHHHFEHGEINNGVLMAAAGKYGYYLGEVNITIENGKIVDKIAKIHPIEPAGSALGEGVQHQGGRPAERR